MQKRYFKIGRFRFWFPHESGVLRGFMGRHVFRSIKNGYGEYIKAHANIEDMRLCLNPGEVILNKGFNAYWFGPFELAIDIGA